MKDKALWCLGLVLGAGVIVTDSSIKRRAVRLPGWPSAFFHDTIIHGIFPQIVPLFVQFAVADNSDLRYNEVGP